MKKIILSTLLAATVSITSFAGPSILSIKENISDSAIVYPESYFGDTHEMMQNWYIQNYIVLDADVEQRSNGTVSDEEYIKRLQALPTIIEMPYNQVVRNHIEFYTTRIRSKVEVILGLSMYYLPILEQALEKEGLPLELKYLAVVESALDPNAVSKAGAAGLWQFMIRTAHDEGLEVNSLVDERRDPYRSSEKAAKFLKKLHRIFGDWSLAIAAYNCGPTNVNKAISRAGGGKKDFWEIYPFLPRETRGYVPGFIAANYVMNYFKYHNLSPSLAKKPLITDTVMVNKRIHFRQISDVLDISMDELRALNPQYRKDVIPGNIHPYTLTLPAMQTYSYIMSEDSIAARNADIYTPRDVATPASIDDYETETTEKIIYHKVKKGESLGKIAKKYGVTVSQLKKWNGLKKNSVKAGKTLKIVRYTTSTKPRSKAETTGEMAESGAEVHSKADSTTTTKKEPKKKKKETTKKKKPRYHTVKKGESLGKIAAKYPGVSIKDIQRANNIKGTKIKTGQKLVIPEK